VLRDDGTLWLNLGDSYAGSGKGAGNYELSEKQRTNNGANYLVGETAREAAHTMTAGMDRNFGPKPKDLIGIPWRVAFALQADGWYLRQDIIWHKPNPMPESVTDRCTKAHEYIFLMSKSARYYFDAAAIKEPMAEVSKARMGRGVSAVHKNVNGAPGQTPHSMNAPRLHGAITKVPETRNRRSVWTVTTSPFRGAHFATFPPKLIEPCILAGCPVGGTVLDPFGGSGTTALVANMLGRKAVLCELNPKYVELMHERRNDTAPLLLSSGV
jgi:site-specific DNA-methyltransferase (adenine-specific)